MIKFIEKTDYEYLNKFEIIEDLNYLYEKEIEETPNNYLTKEYDKGIEEGILIGINEINNIKKDQLYLTRLEIKLNQFS